MITRAFAAFLALVILATVCLAADKPPLTDDLIADYVRLKLASDPEVKGGALQAASKNGVVTITGVVETQRQKDRAAKLARKVKGVKQVVNDITLKDKAAK